MEYVSQSLLVSHNDVAFAARIALRALGKPLNDWDIYAFAASTAAWWNSKPQLEAYVAEWAIAQ